MKSKFFKITLLTLLALSSIGLVGCTSKTDNSSANNDTTGSTTETTEESIKMVDLGNDKITLKLAETGANSDLEQMIISKLNLTDDQLKNTQYYYNYVDLNDDGVDEIFVEVVLPTDTNNGTSTGTTSDNSNNNTANNSIDPSANNGTGTMDSTNSANNNNTSGNVGLIFTTVDGKLTEVDHFTMIQNPIIISDNKTNGWKDILVLSNNSTNDMTNNNTSDTTNTVGDTTGNNTTDQNSIGNNNTNTNATEYTVLTYDGTSYTDIDEATTFVPLDNITGVALIANDMTDSTNANSGIKLSK